MRTISFIVDSMGVEILLGLSFVCVIGIYLFMKSEKDNSNDE